MTDMSRQTPAASVRILLVDDNRLGLMARKAVLEELGYSILTANEGRQALDLFSTTECDLVVTDYKMPKMDGLELIRNLRQRRKDLPVILVSGYADALGLDESNTGANVVIPKSANEVAHLVRAVKRLMRPGVAKKPPTTQRAAARATRQAR